MMDQQPPHWSSPSGHRKDAAVTLGYITIVTPIVPGHKDTLERYLRKDVSPQFDPVAIIRCQNSFRFDQIKGLHFCSLLILHGGEKADASCLVFEATFDGPREEFLQDLLRVAPNGIQAIYENCEGYPKSGLAAPDLVKDYLVRNDAGAQTFFSGSPGRSVSQIRGEKRIRDKIVSFVSRRRFESGAPTTFLDLQRELQQKIIRGRPANRWAEQPAVVPWEVAQRGRVAAAAGLALLILACGLGAFILLLCGRGPADVSNMALSLMSWSESFAAGVIDSSWFLRQIALCVDKLQLPIPLPLVTLIFAWGVLRVFELIVDLVVEKGNPRSESFLWRYLVHVSIILRYALVVFLVCFAVLSLKRGTTPVSSLGFSILLLVAAAVIWLWLRHRATSLELLIQFQRLRPAREIMRRFGLEAVRFAMVVVVVWALLIIGLQMPSSITHGLGTFVFPLTGFLLVLTIYVLTGVLAVYLILGPLLSTLVRCLELADRSNFTPATELITQRFDTAVYERENGGVNKYQNHLASLTYVKPGFLRACLLRITLFVIGLLSRFWFNQGDLGGIPTILAARWVLIDGGRRLLFLTNYGGGWESYLDEFIDMGAVQGLNSIWTNTFIKSNDCKRRYAFPQTNFYLWGGAQAEQPFKAYVRQSQIETIVWYSAYPTLSVINLNTNTDLRQALFKPLAPYELDSVFLKAGL
jgi:hypothetical protein